jgi:hypothetical protein
VTIRIKVAEPLILAKLQAELREPKTVESIAKAVEKEVRRVLSVKPEGATAIGKQLDGERQKLRNLIAVIETGGHAPASMLKAVSEREASIHRLEKQLARDQAIPALGALPDLPQWVDNQLANLVDLLHSDPTRVKAEFRRLGLQLTFRAVEAEPRPYYVVSGQCGLSALVFSYVQRLRTSAVVDRMREQSEP